MNMHAIVFPYQSRNGFGMSAGPPPHPADGQNFEKKYLSAIYYIYILPRVKIHAGNKIETLLMCFFLW
jgi:hypothetical protein